MFIGLYVKYPLFMSDINATWVFMLDFQNILKYKISWKSIQWDWSCSIQTGRHDNAKSRFLQIDKQMPSSYVPAFTNVCDRLKSRSDRSQTE